jgi:hypothetical protein
MKKLILTALLVLGLMVGSASAWTYGSGYAGSTSWVNGTTYHNHVYNNQVGTQSYYKTYQNGNTTIIQSGSVTIKKYSGYNGIVVSSSGSASVTVYGGSSSFDWSKFRSKFRR